jgi:50S ribosomal subunit-associated GTPase HflX
MEENLVRDRKQSFEEIPGGQGNGAHDLTQKIKQYNKIIDEADDHHEVEDFSGRSARSKKKETQYPITRICITGGPCAGKTTALTELTIVLQQMGFRVL